MRMLGFFEKPQIPKEEVRIPTSKLVRPEDVPAEFRAGGVVPSTETDQSKQFTGYRTLDGELIDARTEIDRFNAARGFSPVEGASNISVIPETPQQEVVVPVKTVEAVESVDTEADLIRQRALEMPEGLEGEALAVALEAKRDEFKRYFEKKWDKKMWESNPEKDADLDCLAVLQGRAVGARRKTEASGTNRVVLEKIEKTELAQIQADALSTQQSLLAELSRTPVAETDTRRRIQSDMKQLRKLLKSGTEQDLRKWRDARSQPLSPVGEDDESEWTR